MIQTLLFACDLSAENHAAFARALRLAGEQETEQLLAKPHCDVMLCRAW